MHGYDENGDVKATQLSTKKVPTYFVGLYYVLFGN
jgi:hypothetical protein